jgi:uncharacterized SAM-binding protein YcdF (DUF218 family)
MRVLLTVAACVCIGGCTFLSQFSSVPERHFPQLTRVTWKKKNVIIVLGMRTERRQDRVQIPKIAMPRIAETARLYRDCKKSGSRCLILASGGDPAGNGVSEADVIRQGLIDTGVFPADILIEERSSSTYENAKYCKPILEKEAPDLTVLVTSGPHLSRALLMFEGFEMHPLPAPANYGTD